MRIKVIGVKSEKELLDEYRESCKDLLGDKIFYFIRDFLFIYLAVWLGSFAYCFCQNSLRYYIKHFVWKEQVPLILITLLSFIIWCYGVRGLFKEVNAREQVIGGYERGLKCLDLAFKLEEVKEFVNFEVLENKIKLNHLTNGTLYNILIEREVCDFKIGSININDDALIMDFKNKLVYSEKGENYE